MAGSAFAKRVRLDAIRSVASALGIVLILAPGIARGESHVLKFEKEIGVGQRDGVFGWMSYVSFSPDGKMVASNGPTTPDDVSGDLTFWSFPDGRLIKHLPGRETLLSSDWKYYVNAHGVMSMETGKALISHKESESIGYAFSPDGRYVAESPGQGRHGFHVRLVELASGKQISAFERHDPSSIALSPDGTTLATGHWEIVTLWNMITGKRLAVLRGFGRYVDGLSFSRDGKLLAASTDVGGLQVWDVQRAVRLVSIEIEGSVASEPAFSPDGRLVAVGVYGTGAVWLIDVRTGKIIDHQRVSDMGCGSVAFSPDGRYLITPSTGGLIKWPYDKGGTIRVFRVSDH